MPPSLQRLLKALAYAIVALATGYFVLELVRRFGEIPAVAWTWNTVAAALASCVIGAAIVLTIGLNWFLLLRDQGIRLPFAKALQIVAISQIGKYLPGNVGHFAGRAVLAKQVGIPLGVSASTILIETAWTLAIGAGFSLAALVWYVDTATAGALPPIGTFELALLTLALLFLPWLGISLVNRFAPRLSARVGGGKPVTPPRFWTAVCVSASMALSFFMLGFMVKLHASELFGVTDASWVTLTVLFAAAWLVGYVVPGAPGGLGVREAMMVIMLTPALGPGPAVGLGVTLRLATLAGDGLAFLLGLWSKRHG